MGPEAAAVPGPKCCADAAVLDSGNGDTELKAATSTGNDTTAAGVDYDGSAQTVRLSKPGITSLSENDLHVTEGGGAAHGQQATRRSSPNVGHSSNHGHKEQHSALKRGQSHHNIGRKSTDHHARFQIEDAVQSVPTPESKVIDHSPRARTSIMSTMTTTRGTRSRGSKQRGSRMSTRTTMTTVGSLDAELFNMHAATENDRHEHHESYNDEPGLFAPRTVALPGEAAGTGAILEAIGYLQKTMECNYSELQKRMDHLEARQHALEVSIDKKPLAASRVDQRGSELSDLSHSRTSRTSVQNVLSLEVT